MEDYSQKYKGEHVELALFGGEYQDGVLTAYCLVEDVPHDFRWLWREGNTSSHSEQSS